MRNRLHRQLSEKLGQAVEFYNVNRFLEHLRIYDNLFFGDVHDPAWALANLPRRSGLYRFSGSQRPRRPPAGAGRQAGGGNRRPAGKDRRRCLFLRCQPDGPRGVRNLRPDRGAGGQNRGGGGGPERAASGRTGPAAAPGAALHPRPAQVGRDPPGIWRPRSWPPASGSSRMSGTFSCDAASWPTEHFMRGEDPGPAEETGGNRDFSIYCPTEYLYSRSLLDNLVFGTLKAEQDTRPGRAARTGDQGAGGKRAAGHGDGNRPGFRRGQQGRPPLRRPAPENRHRPRPAQGNPDSHPG